MSGDDTAVSLDLGFDPLWPFVLAPVSDDVAATASIGPVINGPVVNLVPAVLAQVWPST
jgi:hypothetical protein